MEHFLVLIVPMGAMIVSVVVNGGAVCAHYVVVRKDKDAEDYKDICEWWAKNTITIPLTYLLSLFLSFHNLTWFNSYAQFPYALHARIKPFTKWYFCLTSLS